MSVLKNTTLVHCFYFLRVTVTLVRKLNQRTLGMWEHILWGSLSKMIEIMKARAEVQKYICLHVHEHVLLPLKKIKRFWWFSSSAIFFFSSCLYPHYHWFRPPSRKGKIKGDMDSGRARDKSLRRIEKQCREGSSRGSRNLPMLQMKKLRLWVDL